MGKKPLCQRFLKINAGSRKATTAGGYLQEPPAVWCSCRWFLRIAAGTETYCQRLSSETAGNKSWRPRSQFGRPIACADRQWRSGVGF